MRLVQTTIQFPIWAHRIWQVGFVLLLVLSPSFSQDNYPRVFPEQRAIKIRSPESLPRYDIYSESFSAHAPETVTRATRQRINNGDTTFVAPRLLSLDEAIQIALKNSEVVRILGGLSAASSGRTIYDAAIANTSVDINQAVFDPDLFFNNNFSKTETPFADLNNLAFGPSPISGTTNNGYNMAFGLNKQSIHGTTGSLSMNTIKSMFRPGVFVLDPRVTSTLDLSVTQPLLRGADTEANLTPIIVARINTERSFFQYKNSVQNLVRGVIEAYWQLVVARVNVWVRNQQFERGEFDTARITNRVERELDNEATAAQSKVATLNFKSNLISAQATQLQRESALRNLLGLAPEDGTEIVPTSNLATDQLPMNWQELLTLAESNRPDIIELKLVIEADEQLFRQSQNQSLPSMDAVAQYRWNGLAGELPNLSNVSSGFGQFTDWTLGVNFSVPLGLRQARAGVRQQQLIIARDKANLKQGLHAVVHDLATTIRNLDQNYSLYQVFKEAREEALFNLERQYRDYLGGRSIYLNVLLAITDWGNAVSSEANTLAQYNIALSELERASGTILESHGIRFVEERFAAVGPSGSWAEPIFYPYANPSAPNEPRYNDSGKMSESQFELQSIDYGPNSQRRKQ